MLRSGEMDRKATIQTPTDSVNELNEPTLTFSTWKTRMIALLPLSGSEQVNAMSNEASVTHRVRMRYTAGLVPKMRIICQGRTFEIMSVLERGRRMEHECMVNEVLD
jgi:SPP1 family predicted phage head-tail adaptor